MGNHRSITLYFKDEDTVERLEDLADSLKNVSVSSIVDELVKKSLSQIEKQAPKSRVINVKVELEL